MTGQPLCNTLNMATTLKSRLMMILEDLGVNASTLSERAGLARSHVHTMMNSKSSIREPTAQKLAAASGYSAVWIMTGTGPVKDPSIVVQTSASSESASDSSAIDPDADDDADPATIPVLRVRRPRAGRLDIEYVDRYLSRPPVIKSLEGIYEPEVLEAVLLEAAHGEDPGEAFWRAEAERIFNEREKAKAKVRKAKSIDFSMLGSPEKPDE